eukprot:Skav218341  [mRNA]  locus=scaffold755:624672:632918:- [translate_table: standard]
MPDEIIPTWDGDPSTFEAFATNCRWYEMGLKETERKLAAPRIWQRLQGAAKSVVRHLEPKDFDSASGLEKLLRILRDSPLQKLPIPDSFNRLERWTSLRRTTIETIPQLLVREEELFVELQQSLQRARAERAKAEVRAPASPGQDPPDSPTKSSRTKDDGPSSAQGSGETVETSEDKTGFFENEMRGYRLLKAAKLSSAERQHVMTLTRNATHFQLVRQALRSLFDEHHDDGHPKPKKTWFAAGEPWENGDETAWWNEEGDWWDDESAYWTDWPSPTSDNMDYFNEDFTFPGFDGYAGEEPEPSEKTPEEIEEDKRVEEAYTLAVEANRTLAEAKKAVAKVRAARGYYDPTGTKGHTNAGRSKGGGQGKGQMGPCFICKQPGHSYAQCPDRWSMSRSSASSSKGPAKGFGKAGKSQKGKNKGKTKAKRSYFMEYVPPSINDDYEGGIYVMSLEEYEGFRTFPTQRVILDTGATESVAGVATMARVVNEGRFAYTVSLDDRPNFRFGNGMSQRAVSKIEILTPSLGRISFYLLDGSAEMTPPLLGSKDLRTRRSFISYKGDWLAYYQDYRWWASALSTMDSGHLAMDLLIPRQPLEELLQDLERTDSFPGGPGDDDLDDGPGGPARRRQRRADSNAVLRGMVTAHMSVGAYGGGVAGTMPTATTTSAKCETSPIDLDPSPTEVGDPPAQLPQDHGSDVEVDEMDDGGRTSKMDEDDGMDGLPPGLDDGDGPAEVQGQEPHATDVEEPRSETTHNGPPEPGTGSIEASSHPETACQSLAQRLREFRERSSQSHEGGVSFSQLRSTTDRMAMRRESQTREREIEPVRQVDVMCSLRPPPDLPDQGDQGTWRDTPGGTTGGIGDSGPERTQPDLHPGRDEREDLQREVDGGQGPAAGDFEGSGTNIGADPHGRDCGTCHDGASTKEQECVSQKDADYKDSIDSRPIHATDNTIAVDTGGNLDYSPAEEEDHRGLCPGEERGGRRRGGDDSGGDRGGQLGRGAEEGQGEPTMSDSGGRMSVLWNALRNLQQRIRGNGNGSDNSPSRLEAVKDNGTTPHHEQHVSQTLMNSLNLPAQQVNHFGEPELGRDELPGQDQIHEELYGIWNATEKVVRQPLSRRLARAATITAALLCPLQELVGMVQPERHLAEIACSPTSNLSEAFMQNGYSADRINYKTGYDLDSRKGTTKLKEDFEKKPPKLAWTSMKCTRLSGLQNLTQRTPEEWDRFLHRRGQDLRRCEEIVDALEVVLLNGGDIAWEWPTTAVAGWKSKPINKLQKVIQRLGLRCYWINIHGCQYGLEFKGTAVMKPWTILTTNRQLWLTLNKKCDGTHAHVHCRGVVAQASAYYPMRMCRDVVKAMRHTWDHQETSLVNMAESYLLDIKKDTNQDIVSSASLHHCGDAFCGHADGNPPQPEVLALSRTRLDASQAPTGKKLEAVKQLMLRVHRASGHSGMSNLVQLLRNKGAPSWALEIASNLTCPECIEASKPRPRPPASMGELPKIYEILGTDVFEYEAGKVKYKMVLWRDRASGLTFLDHLHTYETGAWEPTSRDLIRSFMKWQMIYPTPRWVMADSARYYTSEEFTSYLNRAGVGLTIAPAEAHWIMGFEESAIGIAKGTVHRLEQEGGHYSIPDLFHLAAAAMNSHVGPSGFSAFQWAFGSGGGAMDDEQTIPGIQLSKSFEGLAKMREKAKIAFTRERASERFSKLANAVGRQASQYKPGQLVMLWRQRVKPGKVKGAWTGPVRVEGTTAWLSSGATLIRAKTNQIRPTSSREEMAAILEGTAVYKTPISVDNLVKSFQGRYYLDLAGDVPSEDRQRHDLGPTSVASQPGPGVDSWSVVDEEGKKFLIRHHVLPRLTLFNPLRSTNCPVSLDELTGDRVTTVRPVAGGDVATIKDTVDVQKTLQDRWTGQTRFELLPLQESSKRLKRPDPKGEKRKHEDKPSEPGKDEGEEDEPQPHRGLVQSGTLFDALRSRGPDVVDGTPLRGASGSNQCPAPGCILPGGHGGHHKDDQEREFMFDGSEQGTKMVTTEPQAEIPSSSSSSSISSSSSEELQEDKPDRPEPPQSDDHFIAVSFDVTKEDVLWLGRSRNRRRADVWLSKKMSEKGKEVEWTKLSIDQKKEFDIAQAKEISNVVISKALRELTPGELAKLDASRVMAMRWVLTRKADNTAKARLVVLGFQAHNITEVETASPTLSKVGRNVILAVTASKRFRLRSGDVTSAFLQTGISLEEEELTILAPPELSAMFGAEDGECKALRVREAFYGLCHAPRKWYEKCISTMRELGWKQLQGDKCVFTLLDERGELCGIAGLHVDDFLISGNDSEVYTSSLDSLQKAFRWGKWETEEITFTGCRIRQRDDFSIYIDQEEYTHRWIEEVNIDPSRSKKSLLLPQEITALRGALGTMSWRATQTGPQYAAEVSLMLSELSKGTVDLMYRVNKLIREMRASASQGLHFPSWNRPLDELAILTWADASQHNRHDRSSTIGIISCLGPKEAIQGEEVPLAVLQWKTGKTPRQCLGSNGAEVQSITIGEDQNYNLRMLIAEVNGKDVTRGNLHSLVREVPGAVIMDSKGIYDAMNRNMSPLHGLRESRAGYELTLAVNQGFQAGTAFRWVNGLAQLGDALTKLGTRKTLLQFFGQHQRWRLIYDEKFESGRRVHKKEMERRLKEMELAFVQKVKQMAEKNNWPWTEGDPIVYHPLT